MIQANKKAKIEANHDVIKQEGYKFFWKLKDINHTFNDEQIEILSRDKQEIRNKAQAIRSELEATNPNIQIIHEFKQKLNDF
mgnify:CR=1 FL=1